MAKKLINLGTSPNKGDGDPVRIAFQKINDNFTEIYDGSLSLPNEIQSTLAPAVSGGYDLGRNDAQWGDLYVEDFIYLNDVRLEIDQNGDLLVDGTSITRLDINASVFADDSTLLVDAVNGVIPGYVSIAELQSIVAQSTDFNDFKTRVASL